MLRNWEKAVAQVTARIPDELLKALDAASAQLNCSRASVIRQALERYLDDHCDISEALERIQDPSDPVLDWDVVRRELLLGAD